MRSNLIPAILALSLSLGGAAMAASTDTAGTIKALDMKAMTVTLEDGTVYYFPATVKLDGFKVGEKVTITWEMKDQKDEASAIKAS